MRLRNPLTIARRAHGALTDTIARRNYHKRLARFTRQGIEPGLTWAGASLLAWELSTSGLKDLPEDRREHLIWIAHRVYRAVVPEMRATYGLRSPGDLPDIDEVLETFKTQAARQVPSSFSSGEMGPHDQSMDIRERTHVAEMLLRHTLAEILVHPTHLEEDLS